jgi:DNA polymerase-4
MNGKKSVKIILHVDMNAFFCSVAEIIYPHLRGKVFAIGRENSYRGVLSTASYEARKLGVHSAMSLKEAYELVPDLMVVSLDYSIYEKYHVMFINILKQYSKLIEVASIDEAYVDITEISNIKHPLVVAKEIQLRILKECGLSCSIGVAPTLFLAKMASDIKKPLGITVLRKRDVQEILYPLSVKEIFGIGKKTYPTLINNGIKTIGDFMNENNKSLIIDLIGENSYKYVINHVVGNSSNVVDPYRHSNSESISTSVTYDRVIEGETEILYELRKLTREVINRMSEKNYSCKTVTITLRNLDFKTITRSKSIDDYLNSFEEIFDIVTELVETNYNGESLRLLGVGVSNLVDKDNIPKEYNLFTISDKDTKDYVVNNLIKEFQQKYGEKALFMKKK